MSDEFDAYYKWFGIPPEQQPPNHYRLLGVPLFVDDDDVIEAAADQRMMLLRSYQTGARGSLSQKLLNEVSNAKVCLLNPARKAPYDAQLQLAIARDKLKKKAARPNMAEPALKVGIPIRDAARPLPQQTPIPVQVPAETKQRRLFGRVDMGSAPSIGIDTQFEADGNRAHSDRSALSHRRRKSKKETMIIASVAVVMVLTCFAVALGVMMSGGPSSVTSPQQLADSDRASVSLSRQENGAGGDRQTHGLDVNSAQPPYPKSDIPGSGANIMPPSPEPPNSDHEKPVVETEPSKPETPNQPNATPKDAPPHDAPPVDPPVADPPPNNPSAGGPPEALKQAYEALQQKNVEQAIALLEKCVADNSPSPYMEEAEELLAQAKTATSDDVAKKVLREWARKLTDKEVQDIADGKPANVKIDVPVQHPILARIFIERTGKHFSSVMLERLNGNIPDVQSGSPPVRRPTDPAVLLATRGLTQEGGRWTLSGMEQELKDQLTKVAALEKKIATARNAVSPRQREAVALARRELAARRALAEKEHQDAIRPGNLIEFRDQEKYEKRIAELQEVEKRLNAAEEKVTQANIAAQAAIEELQPELDLLEEKVKLFEDTYERLTNDEEVLEAIERQGAGSFASSTVLKASQRRAAAIRKALDDGSL